MKVPLSLLKTYLPFTCSVAELSQTLIQAGIEVDDVKTVGSSFSGVVVGEVLSVIKHPSADRLSVAQVTDGTETFQVVCGASNCRPGLKTAFAKIGASLTDESGKPFKIKKGKLRDVESLGMLCGADELGLGTSAGIMELAGDLPLGLDLASLYADVVLDVSLTPNLGHCLSLFGLARELSAHLNVPLQLPEEPLREEGKAIEERVVVDLIDKRQCMRYGCRLVEGVQVGPSPDWLKARLEACGLRSVNNVVDIGNWVMLETGQPLHLFDWDRVEGGRLIVTSQTSHFEMETLDGQMRPLPPEALLICDVSSPLAVGGIMGGMRSAVSETTRTILIEAALFAPTSIRKTSKLLGLKTDSSTRFERGIDPNGIPRALDRAAALLARVAGGKVAAGRIDREAHVFERKKIPLRINRLNQMLGLHLGATEIASLLHRLEMEVREEGAGFVVAPPTYRNDVNAEIDLIEEVARVYGYHNLPKKPAMYSGSVLSDAPLYSFEKLCRTHLLAEGLQEFMTCDLISPAESQFALERAMTPDSLVSVLHSHSVDQSVLRASLLPGLLRVVRYNIDQGKPDLAGFEIGRIHFKEADTYVEPTMAAILLVGSRAPYHFDPKPQDMDFFDLKGILENFFTALKIEGIVFETSHLHSFHPGRQMQVRRGSVILGALGEVHPQKLHALGIEKRVLFAELTLSELLTLVPTHWQVRPWSMLPGSERDWTVTLPANMPVGVILDHIRGMNSELLERVELLDLYKSEQIGEDKKNATFRFSYRDREKTLSLEAVDKEHSNLIQKVLKVLL